MFVQLVVLIGLFLGYIIAKFTVEELKLGLIYFKILELMIFGILSITFLLNDFNILFLIIGLLLGFFLKFEYLFFGLVLFNNSVLLNYILIFIYGLPKGTLFYYNKNLKYLIYNAILFFLGIITYFIDFNLFSLSAGALITLFIIKLRNLDSNF